MEDLQICKICKKVFTDVQGLNKHRMAQHPQQKQIQQSNNSTNSRDIITHQFRNNSNISITRVQKDTINPVVVSQSAMNQNQNSFRKGQVSPSITVRRQESKIQKQGEGARVRPPFKSPDARIKGAASSIKSMVRGATGEGMEMDDDTTDWQKWEPPLPKDRAGDNVPSSTTLIGKTGKTQVLSKSDAEMAISAVSYPSTTARKSVPQLLPMVPGKGTNGAGKRPQGGVKVSSSTPQRFPPVSGGRAGAGANSAVADIMQNLGKMKSMNQKATVSRPTVAVAPTPQKLISLQSKKGTPAAPFKPPAKLPQAQKPQPPQPFRVTKPPQVSKSKSKIVPRNAFNNALPKPGQASSTSRLSDEMEVDSSDQHDEEEESEDMDEQEDEAPPPPPSKKPVQPSPTKAKPGAPGKAPPQKSLNSNRFNPIESPKKGKGKAASVPPPPPITSTASPKGSPNGKSKGAASSTNGTKKQGGSVVAKKSVPPPKTAKNAKKKKKGPDDTFTKMKSYVPTMPGTDYEMPKLSAIGSYTNRAGQQVWVCLVCNEKEHDESSRDMICCEMCEDWYHWECVGIRQAMKEEDPWFCKRCIYQACSKPKKDFPKIFKNDVLEDV